MSSSKSLVFKTNRETLIDSINSLAYNVVKDYKKNVEEKNIQFNPSLLPIYVGDIRRNYEVPVAIYKQFDKIYKIVSNVLKEQK